MEDKKIVYESEDIISGITGIVTKTIITEGTKNGERCWEIRLMVC